ncbi:MAG: hypothetical protein E6Q36_08360 [Chryseobacterium sp.]|nr:MAG: hypothetical protein E6Q36_08360 [Chryseobacterium sp.]
MSKLTDFLVASPYQFYRQTRRDWFQAIGRLPMEMLGTGTPSASTYLRGDGIWSSALGGGGVSSVNGNSGPAVVLTKSDIGLANVDNTSDVNKPISSATQTALNGKASFSHTHPQSDIVNLVQPSGQIVYGSGTGVTSNANFYNNLSTLYFKSNVSISKSNGLFEIWNANNERVFCFWPLNALIECRSGSNATFISIGEIYFNHSTPIIRSNGRLSIRTDATSLSAVPLISTAMNPTVIGTGATGAQTTLQISPQLSLTSSPTAITRGIHYTPSISVHTGIHIAYENVTGDNRLNSTSGNTLVGTSVNTNNSKLVVNGTNEAAQFKVSALNTAPASATATGVLGEVRITSTYIYVCTATNTWVRSALTTW